MDASIIVTGLLNAGDARDLLAEERVHVPHLADNEVASVLRRHVLAGLVGPRQGRAALVVWQQLGVMRHPSTGLLGRVWELRDNLTAYDATYVALAEALDHAFVTSDARLARAPGLKCPLTVLPA